MMNVTNNNDNNTNVANENANDDEQRRCHRRRIAIVGAGITGSVIASYLSGHLQQRNKDQDIDEIEIHIFDQGRRGPGGRSSHRTVQLLQKATDDKNNNNNNNNNNISNNT